MMVEVCEVCDGKDVIQVNHGFARIGVGRRLEFVGDTLVIDPGHTEHYDDWREHRCPECAG